MMKDSIILYPALDRGHLMSTVELGKLIATQHPSISVNIIILTPPSSTSSATHNYLSAVSAASPSITFHHLPHVPLPPTLPPQAISLELCRHSNNNFLHVTNSISQTSNLKAIVLDFMNYTATQVTHTLNIPTYFYYTSGASTLAVFLQLPILHETTPKSIKDLHTILRIPGLPKIHTSELPDAVQDRSTVVYQVYMDMATSMRDSDGVIINSCDAFEGRAISALSNGMCLPEGRTPKVFGVGPVISTTPPCGDRDIDDQSGCLSWLDSQPSQSVVFLCFGSLGTFSKAQLREIAVGLEKSEQRFIWVLRSESCGGNNDSEQSLDELLPEGFMERTKEKGMVVRNWAPQAAILGHDSVGGFVTHCGWNSVLEAVCEGVPMVAWPLYAEQKLNRVIMVHEMKVALGVNESKEGFVSGAELGERVKELMDSDKGKEMRQRIFKMKIGAKEAREKGGSSPLALNRLAQLWKQQ